MSNQSVLRIDISSRKRSFALVADHIDANRFYKLTLMQFLSWGRFGGQKWYMGESGNGLQCSG